MAATDTIERRGKLREILEAIALIIPVFAIVAFFASLEKAFLASVVTAVLWTAAEARWAHSHRAGFWWILILAALVNATAIWLIPIDREFKASLLVGHGLAASELFLLYWLLGRLGRSDESRLTDL